jgi:hypothetical protein
LDVRSKTKVAKDIDNMMTQLCNYGVNLTKDDPWDAYKYIANLLMPDRRAPEQMVRLLLVLIALFLSLPCGIFCVANRTCLDDDKS